MPLSALWRSTLAADLVPKHPDLFDDTIHVSVETDKAQVGEKLQTAHVLVDGNPDAAMLDAPELEHVVVPYVGINDELRKNMLERPHLKLYNSHFNDAFVAQHAVALLLTCANRIIEADAPMRQGKWPPRRDDKLLSFSLSGKTCLLLGYGAIGRELEPRLRGLGLDLAVLKRSKSGAEHLTVYGPDKLHEALGAADVIIASLPSTPDTKNMLDAVAFSAMRPGSILINVGRGDVINQYALYDALESGHLFGAGIDVWWTYPKGEDTKKNTPPSEAPLHTLTNLVMSPHRAAQYQDWELTSLKDVAKTLNAIAKGDIRNLVKVDKGY